jgi:hypothetical protein
MADLLALQNFASVCLSQDGRWRTQETVSFASQESRDGANWTLGRKI